MQDSAFDATDEAAANNAERDVKRHAREDADALRALMHSKAGRAFLYRLLDRCHIYSTPFAPGQIDVTAFNLGEENVGKQLMAQAIDASPDLYMQMLKEQRDEDKRLQSVREREADKRDNREPTGEEQVSPLPPPTARPEKPKA